MDKPRRLWWVAAGPISGAFVGVLLGATIFTLSSLGDGGRSTGHDAALGASVGLLLGAVGGLISAGLGLLAKGILDPITGGPTRRTDALIAGMTAGLLAIIPAVIVVNDTSESVAARSAIAVVVPLVVALAAAQTASWLWDRSQ